MSTQQQLGPSNEETPVTPQLSEEDEHTLESILLRILQLLLQPQPHELLGEMMAYILTEALDPVSKDLLSRYEAITADGDCPEQALCGVCRDPLDQDTRDPPEPIQEEDFLTLICHAEFPEVVAFPCYHLFHSDCLLRWLIQGRTTCPMCRFNVDHGLCDNAEQPWKHGRLEAWVKAKEEKAEKDKAEEEIAGKEKRSLNVRRLHQWLKRVQRRFKD